MTDIFISYSREDWGRAQLLANRLEKQGFTVWWDRKIPPGRSFDEVIQEALDQAKSVIVLWSKTSVKSDWVKEEAQNGAARGLLVPALIDEVPIPLGFGRLQTADLADWKGDLVHPQFKELCRSVAAKAGHELNTQIMQLERLGLDRSPADLDGTPLQQEMPAAPPPAEGAASRSRIATIAIAVLAVILAGALGSAGYLVLKPQAAPEAQLEPGVAGVAAQQAASGPPAPRTENRLAVIQTTEAGEAEGAALAAPTGEPDPQTGASGESPAGRGVESSPPPAAPTATPAAPSGTAAVPAPPAADPGAEAAAGVARRKAEALRAVAAIEVLEKDPSASDEQLAAAYQEVWEAQVEHLEAAKVGELARRMAELEASAKAFAERRRQAEEGGLTASEELALWREYRAVRPGSADASYAAARIAELESAQKGGARIASEDRFVTARGVQRDAEGRGQGPAGISDRFAPGASVYVFAWVQSPGSETLRLEWRGPGGKVVHSNSPRVGRNLSAGYRIYYSKSFREVGDYEVRLYNSQGALIAKRGFRVG